MLSVALLTGYLLLGIMNRKVSRKNKKIQRENRRMTHSVRDYNDLHKKLRYTFKKTAQQRVKREDADLHQDKTESNI